MSEPLSYMSTLEEVISTSDGELRQGLGYLAPDTVMDYVMYLRNQLRITQKGKEAADAEVARLKGVISEKDESLAGFMSALGVSNTPATAPPGYHMSVPAPPPGSTSAVPNLTYTASLSPDSPEINQVHYAELQQGFVIRATFVYKSRTDKFSINLLKNNPKFYIFHLDFRPYPHGSVIVMNTNPDKKWEQEVRAELPQLLDGEICHVTIQCDESEFKVKINDKYVEKSFPYRYPLEDVAVIKLNHGSLGNKWVALSWEPAPAPGKAPNLIDTGYSQELGSNQVNSGPGNMPGEPSSIDSPFAYLPPISEVEDLGDTTFRPGIKIAAKAFFKKGTAKFSINLLKKTGFYIFHLDFRPYPHGSVIVMNTNPNKSWEKEVRAELPHLPDGQLMHVFIECGEAEFKVKVNNNYIEKTFPYRYPLKDVNKLRVVHGTNGNKWITLHHNY